MSGRAFQPVRPSHRNRILGQGKLRMQSPLARRRRLRLYVFLAFALALSVLAVTKTLPYASFLMANTDAAVAASDPSHGFSIGSVRWEVEHFSSAPGLAPFRRYFFETCGGQTGTQAAICLPQTFDRAFPAGTPKHEFLERHSILPRTLRRISQVSQDTA